MKRELRDKWCTALRSGKYKQGRGQLRNKDDEFCCRGVLESLGCTWEDRIPIKDGVPMGHKCKLFPDILSSEIQTELAKMNDFSDYSFSLIADWIENNIPVED